MKCEICRNNDAVIHIQQIIGKERIDLHLCETCALERGIMNKPEAGELSLSSLLTGLIDIRDAKQPQKSSCPRCGTGWQEIQEREQAGCAECYTCFSKEILALMQKSSGKSRHRGKYPRRLLAYKKILLDVMKLKEGLKEALGREDYEKAAVLRDRIKELEDTPPKEQV
jgi:protein arginine kinase activator